MLHEAKWLDTMRFGDCTSPTVGEKIGCNYTDSKISIICMQTGKAAATERGIFFSMDVAI